jgi:hypothetical protein
VELAHVVLDRNEEYLLEHYQILDLPLEAVFCVGLGLRLDRAWLSFAIRGKVLERLHFDYALQHVAVFVLILDEDAWKRR